MILIIEQCRLLIKLYLCFIITAIAFHFRVQLIWGPVNKVKQCFNVLTVVRWRPSNHSRTLNRSKKLFNLSFFFFFGVKGHRSLASLFFCPVFPIEGWWLQYISFSLPSLLPPSMEHEGSCPKWSPEGILLYYPLLLYTRGALEKFQWQIYQMFFFLPCTRRNLNILDTPKRDNGCLINVNRLRFSFALPQHLYNTTISRLEASHQFVTCGVLVEKKRTRVNFTASGKTVFPLLGTWTFCI